MSDHREQILVPQIRLTNRGLSHVRSTMHIILVATGSSGEASEVRSLRVPSVHWATKPYPWTASIHRSTLSTSRNPTPRSMATTLWDLGREPTVNQAPKEPSHNDSPIMHRQQIRSHRPLLPLILHEITFCYPQLKCKTNPHRHTFH
jgi:hypothetical protein